MKKKHRFLKIVNGRFRIKCKIFECKSSPEMIFCRWTWLWIILPEWFPETSKPDLHKTSICHLNACFLHDITWIMQHDSYCFVNKFQPSISNYSSNYNFNKMNFNLSQVLSQIWQPNGVNIDGLWSGRAKVDRPFLHQIDTLVVDGLLSQRSFK